MEKMRKLLSILLCLCMLLQNCPVMAFAADTDNLCEHHTEHTAECGYREGSAGSACTHVHSEECYAILECLHTCGDECANGCTHECSVENGCIIMELDCHHTHGDCGFSEAAAEVPCGHAHNESCGYVQAVAGTPCANAGTDPECDHSGDCGFVAAVEGAVCGHVEHTDCGYVPATEGTPCTHVCEVLVDSADSCYKLLCSHAEGSHDDTCGYVEAVEAHECHYECAECAAALTADETTEPSAEATTEPSTEATEPAPVCDCGTDDPAIHAVSCPVYVAPENPQCFCVEKCTALNEWCDICGFDYTACAGGWDEAEEYASEVTYIESVAIARDGSSGNTGINDCKNALTSAGYTVLDIDLNDGAGGDYIYLGYKTTTDPTKAIRGLMIRNGENPPDYVSYGNGGQFYILGSYTEPNATGHGKVDLNADCGSGSDYLYLYVTRSESYSNPVTALSFRTGEGNTSMDGYTVVTNTHYEAADTNEGAGGKFIYLFEKHFSVKLTARKYYVNNAYGGPAWTYYDYEYGFSDHTKSHTESSSGLYTFAYNGAQWTYAGLRTDDTVGAPAYKSVSIYYDSPNNQKFRQVYSTTSTLSFDANGGSDAPGAINATRYLLASSSGLKEGTASVTIPSAQPVRADSCKFLGWSTDSGATAASYQPGGNYTLGGNTTFYAVWQDHADNSGDGICDSCGTSLDEPAQSNGVYQISNKAELVWFMQYVNKGNKSANAIVLNNIDMGGYQWTPIASTGLYYNTTTYADAGYTGTFDGNGKVISNFQITASTTTEQTYGLFGTISGTVRNLGLSGVSYSFPSGTVDLRAGGVVGQMLPGSTVENCYVRSSTITPGQYIVGGIAACNYGGTIANCYTYQVSVSGNVRCGNLVSDTRGDINNSDRPGTVTNCYTDAASLAGTQTGNRVSGCEASVSGARFASGEITWLLNGGSSSGVWKQTIGTDDAPRFVGSTVYKVKQCNGTTDTYSNDPTSPQTHDFVNNICTKCGTYVDGTVATLSKNGTVVGAYNTLLAAVQAVEGCTAADKAVVKLLKDTYVADVIKVTGSSVFTLDLNGKTVGASQYAVLELNGSGIDVTIIDSDEGGTIFDARNGVYAKGGSTVTISGGTVSGSYGVYAMGSTVNISGGTVSGSSGVFAESGSTVNISGGTVSGDYRGVFAESGSTVNISGGTISGDYYDMYFLGTITAALTLGENGVGATFPGDIAVVGTTLNAILAEGAAYWAGDTMLQVADGVTRITDKGDITVKAVCTHENGEKHYVNNGGDHTYTYSCCNLAVTEGHSYDAATLLCVCGAVNPEAVATVSKNGTVVSAHVTLDSAIAAVKSATAADEAVVTLLKSVESSSSQSIYGGVFTLDLKGFEIRNTGTSGTALDTYNGAVVTVTDSGTGGALVGANYGVTVNSSTLILEDGDIRYINHAPGASAGVKLYRATLTMRGGTIDVDGYGVYAETESTVNISGGSISGGSNGVFAVGESTVTISGGSISGTRGVNVYSGSSVTISGGSISGPMYDIRHSGTGIAALTLGENGVGATFPGGIVVEDTTLNAILGEGTAYWAGDTMLQVADDVTRITDKGDITVKAVCTHENGEKHYVNNGEDHTYTYSCCNMSVTEGHSYDADTLMCACGAVEPVQIYVGGVALAVGEYLAVKGTDGTTDKPQGGYAYLYHNGETLVLELNGYDNEGAYKGDSSYSAAIWSDYALTIDLKGENTITNTATAGDGIYAGGDLTITGNGALKVKANTMCIYSAAAYPQTTTVTITGGSLSLDAGTYGIWAGRIISTGGEIECTSQVHKQNLLKQDVFDAEGNQHPGYLRVEAGTVILTNCDHVFAEEWSRNETHHWHSCTVSGCLTTKYEVYSQLEGAQYAEHSYDAATLLCVCGAVNPEAVATVSKNGTVVSAHVTLDSAIAAVKSATAADEAVVTLLKDIPLGSNYQQITSGVFTLDLNDKLLTGSAIYVLEITGGTVTIADSGENGTIRSTDTDLSTEAVYIDGGTVKIDGGTIVNSTDGISSKCVVVKNGTLTLSGGTVKADSYGVCTYGGTTTITGGTVKSDSYGVCTYGGTTTITGGTIEGSRSVRVSDGNVEITGGTIASSWQDINNTGGTVTLTLAEGKTEGATFPGGLTVYGTTLNAILAEGAAYWQGSKQIIPADGATAISDGDVVIKKACSHSGEKTYTDNGANHRYFCVDCGNSFTEDHTYAPTTLLCVCGAVNPEAVASVSKNGVVVSAHTTLTGAIQAVKDTTEENAAVVTLLKDIDLENVVAVDSGVFTLDLKGCTVTGESYVFQVDSDSVDMTVTDSTDSPGSLVAGGNAAAIYMGNGSVTIEKGNFRGVVGAILQNDGTLTIEGGGFSSTYNEVLVISGGRLALKGGTLEAGEGCGSWIYVKGTAVVSGAPQFTGKEGWADHFWLLGSLDLSGMTDPTGLTVYNETGADMDAAEIPLPAGLSFLQDGNAAETLLNGYTYTIGKDVTAPTVSAGSGSRDSLDGASVSFYVDEDCTYYYAVVDQGAEMPVIDTTGAGTACGKGTVTITLADLTISAKDFYVVVKDAAGNVSEPVKVEIPAGALRIELYLKMVDAQGTEIEGVLDATLNGEEWFGTENRSYTQPYSVTIDENTISDWAYGPKGYALPTETVTFAADEYGNITITSGNATVETDGNKVYIVVALTATHVETELYLKMVDAEGTEIEGVLDAVLNSSYGVGTDSMSYEQPYAVIIGENTISGWDYYPDGYGKPTENITFTADAEGNITITSGNATVETDGNKVYIVVTLERDSTYPAVPENGWPIWVAGTVVTEENCEDVLGDGTVSYDPDTETLTFQDAEIKTEGIAVLKSNLPLTVKLEGSNEFYVESNSTHDYGFWFDYDEGTSEITGTGSLDIWSADECIQMDGEEMALILSGSIELTMNTDNSVAIDVESVDASLTIKDDVQLSIGSEEEKLEDEGIYIGYADTQYGSLTIEDDAVVTIYTSDEEGIYVAGDEEQTLTISGGTVYIDADEEALDANTVTISGGTVTAIGGDGYEGIYADELTISGGSLTVAGGGYGIYTEYDLTITGGTLSASATEETSCAIYSKGKMTITSGSLTASGGGYGIYIGDDLTVNGGTLSASTTEETSCAIYSDGKVTITGGEISAICAEGLTESWGFSAYSDMEISGGKLTASGAEEGIYVRGNVTISGGTVEVLAGGLWADLYDPNIGYFPATITLTGVEVVTPEGGTVGELYDEDYAQNYATIIRADGTEAEAFIITDGKEAEPVYSGWTQLEGNWYYYDPDTNEPVKDIVELTKGEGDAAVTGFYAFDHETGKWLEDTDGFYTAQNGDLYYIEKGLAVKNKGLVQVEDPDCENGHLYYYFGCGVEGCSADPCQGEYKAQKSNRHWAAITNGYLMECGYTTGDDGVIEHIDDTTYEGIYEINGVKFYLMDGVKVHKGLFQDAEGNYYYARSSGALVVGQTYWVSANKLNGFDLKAGNYKFDEEGRIDFSKKNGFYEENGAWYYYEDGAPCYKGLYWFDGTAQEGWEAGPTLNDPGYYYINSSAKLIVNCDYWISKNNGYMKNQSYSFDENGTMYEKVVEKKNGFYLEGGNYYYYVDDVKTYAGLIWCDGPEGNDPGYYYVNSSAKLIVNCDYWISKNNGYMKNQSYSFDENGTMYEKVVEKKNGFYLEGGYYYYYVDDVKTYAGLIWCDGPNGNAPGYYYVNSSAKLITGCNYWISKNNGYMKNGSYTFDENGLMLNPAN